MMTIIVMVYIFIKEIHNPNKALIHIDKTDFSEILLDISEYLEYTS